MGALSEAFVNEKHILTPGGGAVGVALARRGGGLPSPPQPALSQTAKARAGRPLSSLRALWVILWSFSKNSKTFPIILNSQQH